MKYVYPAVFTPEPEGGFNVVVPDLPGCSSCGDNLIEAIEMGRDAMAMWLCDAEDKSEAIPQPQKFSDIQYDNETSFINLIDVDTLEYRRENDNRAIKKTLTIPSWLNSKGEQAGVNFSQLLQDALKKNLGLENYSKSIKKQP